MSKKLLPCPLCGLSLPVSVVDASEIDRGEPGTYRAVLCDFKVGGCGTSSGFRDTKKEARRLWNTRHYAAFGTAAKPCDKVPEQPPADNAHVVEGSEKFHDA